MARSGFKMKGSAFYGHGNASPMQKEKGTKQLNVKTGEERTDYEHSFVITKEGTGNVKPKTKKNASDWVNVLPTVNVKG